MFVSSTGAVAATIRPTAPQQIEPWAALSVLSAGAPAAALCGAAVTAAQAPAAGCVLPAVDAAPPPVVEAGPPPPTPIPPVEPASEGLGLGVSPLILALGAIAVGAAVYFLLIKKKHHNAVSPA
jgi:hypothetical protein